MDDYRALENLVFSYASLVAAGDFAGVGGLFAKGAFVGSGGLPRRSSGCYRFTRADHGWRFTERRATVDLVGDVSHHLRAKRP
ncbi:MULTISPECIES: hypothetical protein [Amycolatopsis]|uniref:SnoaL-like domain-containing protein n=1 Tax=Amycolatopsis bullii TaxID=941987 RepID=A0ABQ3K6D8_9PSEU|nr:hypothetical protein [Amycolatopsis bullii]GHG01212.1 hypothetical protein GCM10017567_15510 [Amycolatopsis bullii]